MSFKTKEYKVVYKKSDKIIFFEELFGNSAETIPIRGLFQLQEPKT